jgi:hypothetical protein
VFENKLYSSCGYKLNVEGNMIDTKHIYYHVKYKKSWNFTMSVRSQYLLLNSVTGMISGQVKYCCY